MKRLEKLTNEPRGDEELRQKAIEELKATATQATKLARKLKRDNSAAKA